MKIPKEFFVAMVEVVEEAGIQFKRWSIASGLPPERISEFNRLCGRTKSGSLKEEDLNRLFTFEKAIKLLRGIKVLMGTTGVEKVFKKLPDNLDPKEEIYMIVASLPDEDIEKVLSNVKNILFEKYGIKR